MPTWLLALLACGEAPKNHVSDAGPSADSGEDSGDAPCTDADADGACADVDCDDADAAVLPGAAEVCDGVDQDCDGVADDGLVTDGQGCADETPTWDDTFDTLQVTVRTADEEYAATDEAVEICVAEGVCHWIDTADWNDWEQGQVGVYHLDAAGLARAAVDRVTLTTRTGDNGWTPACVSVSGDGEPLLTRVLVDVRVGTGSSDEVETWEGTPGIDAPGCFDAPLTHGPMVGAVGDTTAILWFRTDASRAVEVRVADDEDTVASAAPVHVSWPAAERDFTATVSLQGLTPDHTWHYSLTVEGETFGPYSFHTAPSQGAVQVPLRVAVGSCARDDAQPIFAQILAESPDVFLFVGDNHYGNTADRDGQRAFYREAHGLPERAELLRGTSVLATWDDHDYAGDNTDGSAAGREDALAVFQSYWANPAYGTEDTPGTFFRWRTGDVEIFAVDGRYWKDLEDSTLGAAQLAWLVDALAESTATFKLVASGTQITADYSDDAWFAHEADRDAFLAAIADVPGVILLSGDVHRSELREDDGAAGFLPEITSSPLANGNTTCRTDDEVLACYDDGNAYVVLELDTTAADPSVEARIVREDGETEAVTTWRLSDW